MTSTVQLKIDNLTNDEDHKQELWLHYISGNSLYTFEDKLEKIKLAQVKQEHFIEALSNLYKNPPSTKLVNFLDYFSDFERSIMFLLLLGFSVREVSEYKGINSIRIKQSIVAIRKHTAWKKNGIKDKIY